MATYKVIQDIEAEDKLLGPLTMRQFVYAAIVAVSAFIAFRLLFVAWWLALPLLPHMILFAILAAPFGHDQSSEVWLLAKIRFFLKPRRRIWDQTGVKELVTITAPKKVNRVLTNNLTQAEVKSRLQALANTIDSRGWVIKNVNVNMLTQPSYLNPQPSSDRLIDMNQVSLPANDDGGVAAADDILDERNNATAQNLDRLIAATAHNRRQELISRMQQPEPEKPQQSEKRRENQAVDYWFLNGSSGQQTVLPGYGAFGSGPVTSPGTVSASASTMSAAEEAALAKRLKAAHNSDETPQTYGHMKVIKPLSVQQAEEKERQMALAREAAENARIASEAAAEEARQKAMKTANDPVILELSQNDDLNVATIARQAKKREAEKFDGEVVIQLH